MDDVARHLGLSRTTVSFVINRRADIKIAIQTQQRVWDAVAELGYRPHAGARSLASSRTHLIGLVTDIPTSPFAGGIISGAQRAAWQRGQLLLIMSSDGVAASEDAMLETLLERRVEGLIYATDAHREVSLPAVAAEVPVVLVHCFDREGRFPTILPDEEHGGYIATRRLIEARHRRIALLNLAAPVPAAGRRAGYERALAEAGIPLDPGLVVSGEADATGGFLLAEQLLRSDDPPTGFFCGTDRMAMGAYDAIKERGLRIPEDIGVVGYDNQELIAAYLRPALTTVELPFDAMGAAAIEALADPSQLRSLVVEGPLIDRASV
jgi:LacI family transcriptional regulator